MTGWLIYDKEDAKRNTWFINEVKLRLEHKQDCINMGEMKSDL